MSATLTWFNSGLGTKTGTTINTSITDLVTLINSKSADANFSWVVASSNAGTTPLYIVLKRKNGSPGRILLVAWTSPPAANHVTLLDQTPVATNLYISYFPNGNVDTPSNLTAASGTILGDDTGATKVTAGLPVASYYPAGFQPWYFDSQEAVVFGFGWPGAATSLMFGAGYLVVDSADVAYPAVLSLGGSSISSFGTTGVMPWLTTVPIAGASTGAGLRIGYGGFNSKPYFAAWVANAWANTVVGPLDILTDTAQLKAWFVPYQLLGQDKGEGFVLKLRQIGYGPGSVGPFQAYQTSGPVVQARQFCHATAGGTAFPWVVNFKI